MYKNQEIPFEKTEIISSGLAELIAGIQVLYMPVAWVKSVDMRSLKIMYLSVSADGAEKIFQLPKSAIEFYNCKTDRHLLVFEDEFELLKKVTDEQIDCFTYNLRDKTYPDFRGATFRSVQVYFCPLCGALSNKIQMGGCPGYGIRVVCPNIAASWHKEEIESLKKEGRRDGWGQLAIKKTPESEVKRFRNANRKEIKNNLFGGYDLNLEKEEMSNWQR